ncbi:dienelactone hydrolase [Alishewanella longhuensis]|uniref:Dienelactone hydrolase n=1 Tax=Alishewanella longhuensis TaxID=1091037 RepID=A0ABQ3KV03_9ALTE|nr:hypothetical protein [Alishewanella longhuensis]GHG63161.1 dienelactone hydrolase [Alishewanella longhuensis]
MQHFLIVTDIFGQCHGLQPLLSALAAPERQFTLLDPYQGKSQAFLSEQQAYAAYTAQCGHEQYAELVARHLASWNEPINLAIGFSAGASALWWAIAGEQGCHSRIQHGVLFYPGQIYKHLDLQPQIAVKVILAASEPHFAVTDLCLALSQKAKVDAVVTPYEHGFMNPASQAFDLQSFTDFAAELTAAR